MRSRPKGGNWSSVLQASGCYMSVRDNAYLDLQILWALCVYLEAVSVLPQLRMMQNAKVVEKFTAHYVFALGLSRFVSCAHWVLQVRNGLC
jgi:ER lumen protein retaining receptor